MFRKAVAVITVVLVQAGVVVGLSDVAGANPVLTGNVSCSVFGGAGHFNPKIKATGAPGGIKIQFAGKVAGCTGGSIAAGGAIHTVVGAAVTGSGYFTGATASKCTNFEGAAPPDAVGVIKMKVTWILSPPLAVTPSHVKYGLGGAYSAPVAGTIMGLELGIPVTTPTVVTGSYAGSLVQDTLMNVNVPVGGCPVGPPFNWASGHLNF